MSWVINNSNAFRILFGAVALFCFTSTAFAIELGAGETYQQLPGSDSDYEDLIMHPGSEILAREDGMSTSFEDGSFRFNEARVQGDLQLAYGYLDMYQTEVFGNFQAPVYGANIERSTFHNLNVDTYYDEINLNYVAATDAHVVSEDNINIFTGYFNDLNIYSWRSIDINTLSANKLQAYALDGISLANADVLGDTVINVDYGPAKISKLNTHSLNLVQIGDPPALLGRHA